MADKIEGLIKMVYRRWKKSRIEETDTHPDEETFVRSDPPRGW